MSITSSIWKRRKPSASAPMLISPNKAMGLSISTHSLLLRMLAEYLTRITGAKVALLTIQLRETEFGEGLSEELREAAEEIADILLGVLPHH